MGQLAQAYLLRLPLAYLLRLVILALEMEMPLLLARITLLLSRHMLKVSNLLSLHQLV